MPYLSSALQPKDNKLVNSSEAKSSILSETVGNGLLTSSNEFEIDVKSFPIFRSLGANVDEIHKRCSC